MGGKEVTGFLQNYTFLLHNIDEEISKLSFCQITKVARYDVQRAHILAKHALDFFVPRPDNGERVSFQPSSATMLTNVV